LKAYIKATLSVIKVTLTVIGVIAVILFIAGALFLHVVLPEPLSQKATAKDFAKNQDNILLVTRYLINCNDNSVYINTNSEEAASIEEPQVTDAINTLYGKGYRVINKNGNTIHFQRSTRLMDFESGIAYSIDGSEPRLTFLTKLVSLSESNWYYYEADFNEFKRRELSGEQGENSVTS
jgi:hypothetical protein